MRTLYHRALPPKVVWDLRAGSQSQKELDTLSEVPESLLVSDRHS